MSSKTSKPAPSTPESTSNPTSTPNPKEETLLAMGAKLAFLGYLIRR